MRPIRSTLQLVCTLLVPSWFLCTIIEGAAQEKQTAQTNASVPKQTFRSTYVRELCESEVVSILEKYDFYCAKRESSSYNYRFSEYSNLGGRGFPNDFQLIADDRVVYDRTSGLMWQQSGSSTIYSFKLTKVYIDLLNARKYAGFDNWRLPTLEEALTLVEPEKKANIRSTIFADVIPLHINPIFGPQFCIWTGDECRPTIGWSTSRMSVWAVDFSTARCEIVTFDIPDPHEPYSGLFVRAVRSAGSTGEYNADQSRLDQEFPNKNFYEIRAKYAFLLDVLLSEIGGKNYMESIVSLQKWYSEAKSGNGRPAKSKIASVFKDVLNKYPPTYLPEVHYKLGIIYSDLGNYKEAKKWLKKAADQGLYKAVKKLDQIRAISK